jgi:hypothetical protein
MEDFTQLCVWPATLVGQDRIKDFEQFMLGTFNTRIKYAEEVLTKPNEDGEGGRNDVFFFVHTEDVPKFAVPRLQYGIRWWEDVKNVSGLYPSSIVEKYPKTW